MINTTAHAQSQSQPTTDPSGGILYFVLNPELCCAPAVQYLRYELSYRMPHIGCGADVLRWRREKEKETKRLQSLGLIPIPEEFKPAKNAQYPHHTIARDPDVFNARRCSWEKIAKLQKEKNQKSKSASSTPVSPTSPLSSHPSHYKSKLVASNPSLSVSRRSALLKTKQFASVDSGDPAGIQR